MIPPWPSPYGGPSDELPYHLRPTDLLRADEPWIATLYIDGPDPAVAPAPAVAGRPSAWGNSADGAAAGAPTDRPPGPSVPTATGRPGGHHGDRDETGLPADRTVRPAPAVLSAPGAAGGRAGRLRGRHRAASGAFPSARAYRRAGWALILAAIFAGSFVVAVLAALIFAAYGRR